MEVPRFEAAFNKQKEVGAFAGVAQRLAALPQVGVGHIFVVQSELVPNACMNGVCGMLLPETNLLANALKLIDRADPGSIGALSGITANS